MDALEKAGALAQKDAEFLRQSINDIFNRHGSHERMRDAGHAARCYANLFSLMLGVLAARVGPKEAIRLVEQVIILEHEQFVETSVVVFSSGKCWTCGK